MNCHEVRECLFAFLDNELEAGLSLAVQTHLEGCGECAREAEIERAVGKHLKHAVEAQTPIVPFSFVPPQTKPNAVSIQRRPLWKFIGYGVAAAVFIAALVVTYSRWMAPQHNPLPDVLIADFDHFLSQGKPLHFASSDAQATSQWLQRELALDVAIPPPKGAHCKLMGARKCKLGARDAALAFYEMSDGPVTLLAFASQPSDTTGLQSVGEHVWMDKCKGHTVVLCSQNGMTYAAVATLPVSELIHLMPCAAE